MVAINTNNTENSDKHIYIPKYVHTYLQHIHVYVMYKYV